MLHTSKSDIVFQCKSGREKRGKESWMGTVSAIRKFGSHFEMQIQSRSSILVLFGKTSFGYFACMPDFCAGCHLVDFKDLFWNTQQLVRVLGKVDGITVAKALYTIADIIDI